MKSGLRASLILAVTAFSIGAQSQTAQRDEALHPNVELKLRIIPDKETYSRDEDVSARIEFINLTDKTLCFPEPAQGAEVSGSGYLTTRAALVNPTEGMKFEDELLIDHYGGGPTFPREKLVSEIEQSWVKLAPNQAYVVTSAKATLNLHSTGPWRLWATYNPPECSYNVAECMLYLKSTAESVGCTVPEKAVTAKSVMVNVVPPPEQKQSIK